LRLTLPRPLHFFFEERKKFAGAALQLFREFKAKSTNADLFGSAKFGSNVKFKPLQAADLLVGIVNRHFKEQVFDLPYRMRKPLDRLNRRKNLMWFSRARQCSQPTCDFCARARTSYSEAPARVRLGQVLDACVTAILAEVDSLSRGA